MSHLHEKIDFVVNSFIVHDQKVLMIHHKQIGRWLPIGEHIELVSSPAINAGSVFSAKIVTSSPHSFQDFSKHRFIGAFVNTEPQNRPTFIDIHDIKDGHRHVSLNYVFTTADDTPILLRKSIMKYAGSAVRI